MLLFAHVVTRVLGSVAGLGAHAPLRSGHRARRAQGMAVAKRDGSGELPLF